MRFLHPAQLHWLWLALVPIALWLFRRKARRVPVSTLLFFRSLAREHQESAWLRRLKRLLSLLLSLLVVALAALALARPFREGGGDVPRSVVILLDRSASMSAAVERGPTRLAEAVTLLKDRLKALPENVVTSLVIYDAKAEVAQSRSTNRRELLRLLDQTAAAPVEDRPDEALAVARRLAALDAPSQIWHVSDRHEGEAADAGGGPVSVRRLGVALGSALNVGVTGFQVRPAPLARNRFEAFVEVSASSGNRRGVEVTLEARLDGRPVQLRRLDLEPGGRARLILPLEGGKGQMLELEARCAGDCLGWDNAAIAPLPEPEPLVVGWFTDAPDPFVELALSSLLAEEQILVLKGGGADYPPKEKPDVYVFENWLPKEWPVDRPALVLNPPSSSGPIRARKLDRPVPYDSVRAVQPDHPVLYRVTSGRVAVSQTTVMEVGDTLETLWMAGQEPVLAAGEAGGQRLVVTAFLPGRSEQLALLPAFPLLVGNALYWCAASEEGAASLKPRRPGDLVPVEPGMVKWRAWDGERFFDASDATRGGWLELRRLGVLESPQGRVESSLLLSARESNLPAPAAEPGVAKAPDLRAERWATGGGWWTKLLWIALFLLLAESWLFHRQAVY